MSWPRTRPETALVAVVLLLCGFILLDELILSARTWGSDWMINGDYRQNMFWAPSLERATLYRNDTLAQYSRDFNTPGVTFLYWLAVNAGVSGVLFSKLLSWVCVLTLLAGAVALGLALGRRRALLTTSLLLLLILLGKRDLLGPEMGGLSRNFAFPLQAWFFWALVRRKAGVALAITVLASFLHPPTFLTCLASLAAEQGLRVIRLGRRKRAFSPALRRLLLTLSLGIVAAVPIAVHSSKVIRTYGPVVTRHDVATMPEYQKGGRWEREKPRGLALSLIEEAGGFSVLHRGRPTMSNWHAWFGLLILGSCAWWAVHVFRRERRACLRWKPLGTVMVCCLLLFELASLLLARLYFPNRYLRPAFRLLPALFLAERIAHGPKRGSGLPARMLWGVWVALIFIGSAGTLRVDGGLGFTIDTSAMQGAAAYIRTLPDDAVIAAFPAGDGDDISVVGERSVYLQREVSHALYKGYIQEIRRRTVLLLAALFPVGPDMDADVARLASERVGYVLINNTMMTDLADKATIPRYDQPYGNWLAKRMEPDKAKAVAQYWSVRMKPFTVYEDARYRLVAIGTFAGRGPADGGGLHEEIKKIFRLKDLLEAR